VFVDCRQDKWGAMIHPNFHLFGRSGAEVDFIYVFFVFVFFFFFFSFAFDRASSSTPSRKGEEKKLVKAFHPIHNHHITTTNTNDPANQSVTQAFLCCYISFHHQKQHPFGST